MLAMICGYSPAHVDAARLPLYLNHTPSGTSVKNIAQWCQVRTALGRAWAQRRAWGRAVPHVRQLRVAPLHRASLRPPLAADLAAGRPQAIRAPEPDVMSHFDYGTRCVTITGVPRDCNQRRYHQDAPPRYDLSRITTPLAIFSGGPSCTRARHAERDSVSC